MKLKIYIIAFICLIQLFSLYNCEQTYNVKQMLKLWNKMNYLTRPRTTPQINKENSISEIVSTNINGVEQFFLIRGNNLDNPVLLFLHGGPGTAQISLMRNYQSELEKHYTVVQWDQRGSGLSRNADLSQINMDLYLKDGEEVINYLLHRFNKQQVYLVGHSFGSSFAYQLSLLHPDKIKAVIGLGQVSKDIEPDCYQATLQKAIDTKNIYAQGNLTLLGPPPYRNISKNVYPYETLFENNTDVLGMRVRYYWADQMGGDAVNMNMMVFVIKELLYGTEYNLLDAMMWNVQKGLVLDQMFKTGLNQINLYEKGTNFSIPIYFIQGKYDLLTLPSSAQDLMNSITAPKKGMFIIDNVAHELHWENPILVQNKIIELFSESSTLSENQLNKINYYHIFAIICIFAISIIFLKSL